MARVTPQEYAEKWSRRLKGAGQDISAGVKRVTEAPGAAAARQAQVMLNNLTARVADGTWARNVGAVTVDEWRNSVLNKGLQRIAAGVDAALPNQAAMAQQLLSAIDGAVAVVDRTPRGDLATNIQRAVTFMQEMANRAPSRGR